MIFNIPFRFRKLEPKDVGKLNDNFDYIQRKFQIYPRLVTYTVSMNNDIAGNAGEIVLCSTDNKFYGCTVSGKEGLATWVSFN